MTLNEEELEQHRAMLCRFLLFLLGDVQDAEDLAQESFRVAATKEPGLEQVSDCGAWLRSIARNLARNYVRKRRRSWVLLDSDALELAENRFVETGSDRDDVWEVRRQALAACLAKLPSSDRELLRRRYQLGQRVKDIASELGMEPNSLSKRLERLREWLRDAINAAQGGEGRE